LLLALASVCPRRVLVFDEPTSGLDARNMEICASVLRDIADSGRCVVLVTHDRDLVRLSADTVVYLHDGKIRYRRRVVRNAEEADTGGTPTRSARAQ
jgi:energy-coupling factor transport system ATP-binding protein